MGALIGMQFAASHPDKVASLFLLAPLPFEEVGHLVFFYSSIVHY